jgi:hypothetical protein
MTRTTVLSSAARADRRVANVGGADERAGRGIDDGAVDLESCSAGMSLSVLWVGAFAMMGSGDG